MDKMEKLVDILERLNKGDITEELRAEAQKMVANIDALELSLAEQKLIEKGTKVEDLRNLCEIHMDVLKDEIERLKLKLTPDHVLSTLLEEHDEIMKLLSNLEKINNEIQEMDSYKKDAPVFGELLKTAETIIDAENHHRREENVLFPELEARAVTGPTRIMRMEHDLLRAKKQEIRKLALEVDTLDFESFKASLDTAAKYLIFNLRDHIYKENHILYPTAIDTISDKALWSTMKENCDKIGYCSFTPKH